MSGTSNTNNVIHLSDVIGSKTDSLKGVKDNLSSTLTGKNLLEEAGKFFDKKDFNNAFLCYYKLYKKDPTNTYFLERAISSLKGINEYKKSLELSKILYCLDPASISYTIILIDSLYNNGSFKEAFNLSDRLVHQIAPNDLQSMMSYLQCLIGVNRFEESISLSNKLLKEIKPEDYSIREYVLFAKVRIFSAQEKSDEALNLLNYICIQNGDEECSEYLGIRALCYYNKGLLNESKLLYTRLIADPSSLKPLQLATCFYRMAMIHLNEGELHKALECTNKSLRINNDLDTQILKVDILLNIGMINKAMNLGKKLLKKSLSEEQISKLNYHLGCCHLNLLEYDESLTYFGKIKETDSLYLQSKMEFWDRYIPYGEMKKIIGDIKKHYKRYPKEHKIGFYLGMVYRRLEDDKNSIYYLKEYLVYSPKDTIALFNLAQSQYNLGLYNDSDNTYNKILDIEPKNVDVLYKKALICDAIGDCEQGIYYLEEILRIVPSHIDALLLLGKINMDLEKYDDSFNNFQAALQLSKNDHQIGESNFNLGLLFARKKENDTALSYFEKISESYSKDPELILKVSQCEINIGKTIEAKKKLIDVMTDSEDDNVYAEAVLMDSYLEYTMGNYEQSIKILEEYMNNPRFVIADEPLVLNNIAICHLLMGNTTQGLKMMKSVYMLDSTIPEITVNFNISYALKETVEKEDLQFLYIGKNY